MYLCPHTLIEMLFLYITVARHTARNPFQSVELKVKNHNMIPSHKILTTIISLKCHKTKG